MGKHSQGGGGAFWRSIALTGIKWVVIASLPILAAFGAFYFVRQGDSDRADRPRPKPSASPSVSPSVSPIPSTTPSPSPSASITLQGKVQVLDGASDPQYAIDVKTRLSAAGVDVFGPANAARRFPETIVFYHPGAEEAARAVAEFFGIDKVEPAPKSLDPAIPVTVVAGEDYEAISRA